MNYLFFFGMGHTYMHIAYVHHLDFPIVDWVYQHDCPEDWKTYSHRVGRTARNKASGQALLVLLPSEEEPLVQQLKAHKFPIDKIE